MTKFYVYEHWRLDRDECFYVGKGQGRRAYAMRRNRNRHHLAIQAKVSREGFGIEVRMVATGLDESEAHALEIERIAFWRSVGIDLANYTSGGEGVTNPPPEVREKIAAAQRGRKMPYWHQKDLIEAARTPEARAKMSAAKKGRPVPPPKSDAARARMSQGRPGGWQHTDEAKRKITEALRLRVRTKETGRKLSAALMGHPGAGKRSVICLDDGMRFDSVTAAAKHYAIDGSSISEVCRAKRYSAGDRKFRYEDA
jgi:NUMOD3 motif